MVGSNIFNTLRVPGLTATVAPEGVACPGREHRAKRRLFPAYPPSRLIQGALRCLAGSTLVAGGRLETAGGGAVRRRALQPVGVVRVDLRAGVQTLNSALLILAWVVPL